MSEQLFEGRHRALLVSRTHGDAFRFASHPPPDTCAVFGHDGKCRHSSLSGLPGWANEMACLQTMQPGAIQASLVKWAERWTTPSVIPRARHPRSTEAGRGTTGYYVARPARAESISPRDRLPAGLVPRLPVSHGRSRLGRLFAWFQVVSEARAV